MVNDHDGSPKTRAKRAGYGHAEAVLVARLHPCAQVGLRPGRSARMLLFMFRIRVRPVLAALGLAVLATPVAGQSSVDPAKLGPQVGERVRPFTLPDQSGTPREFSALAGPNGTMLVFFRSSDW